MPGGSRRRFLATIGAAGLAGCLGSSTGDTPTAADTPRSEVPTDTEGSEGAETDSETPTPTPSLASFENPPLADHLLPMPMDRWPLRLKVVSGGQPRDGIPPIDEPKFMPAEDGDAILADDDVVFGVAMNGKAKAYPQPILVWHEIVNDVIDDVPVSVTYCPLTGTAMGFHRGDTSFGTTGRLLNNNLVMYDRATESWWPQVLASSIPGPWNEEPGRGSLREFQVIWTTWKRWKARHPETRVLSEQTGHVRNYDRDPYGGYTPASGYYASDSYFAPPLNPNDDYHPKEVFIGARDPNGAIAVRKSALADAGVLTGSLGESSVVAAYDPALDTAYIYRNPEKESFEFDGGSIVGPDGSVHAPDELPLNSVVAFDAMWFAWSGYYPEGEVVE